VNSGYNESSSVEAIMFTFLWCLFYVDVPLRNHSLALQKIHFVQGRFVLFLQHIRIETTVIARAIVSVRPSHSGVLSGRMKI